MSELKAIEDKLNSLPEYLEYYTDKRIENQEYIWGFDLWYSVESDIRTNEQITHCGTRRSGRTTAMVKNTLHAVTKGKSKIMIAVPDYGHIWYIVKIFAKYVTIVEDKRDRTSYGIVGYPHVTIKFNSFHDPIRYHDNMRGRNMNETAVFADHTVYEQNKKGTY